MMSTEQLRQAKLFFSDLGDIFPTMLEYVNEEDPKKIIEGANYAKLLLQTYMFDADLIIEKANNTEL